jgi:hypothetical protein
LEGSVILWKNQCQCGQKDIRKVWKLDYDGIESEGKISLLNLRSTTGVAFVRLGVGCCRKHVGYTVATY